MARFDEILATFWAPDESYGSQPALTDEAVREAERVLGVTLPSGLLELLRVRNGGVVAAGHRVFRTSRPTSWDEDRVPFETVLGIGKPGLMRSLLDSPYLAEEWGLPSPVVILSGEGHWWIALDYRECGPAGEPSVTWFETDFDTELALAGDFRTFVEGLTPS
ncbi:hypothetical protein SRB5_45880 [Streptomyces sp. RB5]|uniref:Knr4/Smi1-like domain-containing protein n=1 Tax=Streptomyces smaragdinus TaxID=2585196 RepID=A0A7K0CLY1_9ACTN|nr:SMI1/KNR4 family protein [Streptomyces smaragdinus]MQY14421.1 hypothetical protein [Streptomyces smaragdinus]